MGALRQAGTASGQAMAHLGVVEQPRGQAGVEPAALAAAGAAGQPGVVRVVVARRVVTHQHQQRGGVAARRQGIEQPPGELDPFRRGQRLAADGVEGALQGRRLGRGGGAPAAVPDQLPGPGEAGGLHQGEGGERMVLGVADPLAAGLPAVAAAVQRGQRRRLGGAVARREKAGEARQVALRPRARVGDGHAEEARHALGGDLLPGGLQVAPQRLGAHVDAEGRLHAGCRARCGGRG